MDIREQLLNNFPSTIDKTGKNFGAIVSNENRTGATEKVLQEVRDFAIEYIKTPEVLKQKGEMLEETMAFLTYLKRFTNETEEAWKERYKAIFVRNHDKTWGTCFDIKSVFKSYFPSSVIYLVENTNSVNDNLIVNGDFIGGGSGWNLENCQTSSDARFSKGLGVALTDGCRLSQATEVISGKTYYLHFFAKGGVSISIKNDKGLFWNPETKGYQTKVFYIKYNNENWEDKSIFFYTDDVNSIRIELTLNNENTYGYVDYFRLFKKEPYPSFTIIAYFEGSAAKNAIALAEGSIDDPATNTPPDVENKALKWGYYDKDALTGVATGFAQDIYQDLLNMVKPAGVKAYIEIVNKDYKPENIS